MSHKGFSHIGLSTLDLDRTRDFYENVLGFPAVRDRFELSVRRLGLEDAGALRSVKRADANGDVLVKTAGA